MKKLINLLTTVALGLSLQACPPLSGTQLSSPAEPWPRIIDHRYSNITGLSAGRVAAAKTKLNIKYWHTSHGSQLSAGMRAMDAFYGATGLYALNGSGGLVYDDTTWADLGNSDFNTTTRAYLNTHPLVNVVMWSWCAQVSGSDEDGIAAYLSKMSALESEFPNLRFVYMTGHADGSGETGNLHVRNRQIREYCVANNKFLFDFYDIECYDPSGRYFGDHFVTDGCNYDTDGDGHVSQGAGDPGLPTGGDKSWALDWQAAHPGEWWDCDPAHTVALNGNQKAKAAWQLFARLAESLP